MYRKNVASQYIYFGLVNASTGAALTGATVTAYRALDNGAQASATGTTTELGNGQYRFNLSQADTNGNQGSYLFTASGAVPVEKTVVFTAADPTNATTFGLTNLDAAVSTRSTYAGADTSGTTTLLSRLTSTRAGLLDNLDATISSRLSSGSYVAAPSAAAVADAVWDEAISGHLSAGSTGAALNAAGSAGDPWSTPLPGAYGAGTAGHIVGNQLDAAVSSRSTLTAAGVRTELTTELGRIDAAVSTRLASTGVPTNFSSLSITAGGLVRLDLTQTLSAARALTAVGDTSLTLNDALHSAVASVAGQQTAVSTTYTTKTSAGTVLRVFTLDSATTPTSRT